MVAIMGERREAAKKRILEMLADQAASIRSWDLTNLLNREFSEDYSHALVASILRELVRAEVVEYDSKAYGLDCWSGPIGGFVESRVRPSRRFRLVPKPEEDSEAGQDVTDSR
jgi:hypothetical protein